MRSGRNRVLRLFKLSTIRFVEDRRANIAVIFALALVPIMLAVGATVDYSAANKTRSRLNAVADAAALSAVGNVGMTKTAAIAQTDALTFFSTQAALVSPLNNVTPSAKVTDGANGRTAVVSYSASAPTYVMGVMGMQNVSLQGTATATSGRATYIDMYALLDNSSSMGLASTSAGQNKLASLTGGCAFGCHVIGALNDNYKIAKNNNVEMRIDVLRNSWINMINSAKGISSQNNFRFAAYTFNSSVSTIQALTSSLSTASASAQNIDLAAVPITGPGNTYTDNAINALTAIIPAAGDGSSASSSKKYLLLVTDGVQDFQNLLIWNGHQSKPVTSSVCASLKNRGVQIAVIYTTYLTIPLADDRDGNYRDIVAPISSQIEPALQACASPNLYFAASDSTSIANAFDTIYKTVLARPYLAR
jgi:Flp pilus assembly protein TadG